MDIKIREISESDFPALVTLFKEFATFEKLSEKMVNSVELMSAEKEHINGFVAETNDKEIIGYVIYFFAYYTWIGKSLYMYGRFLFVAFLLAGGQRPPSCPFIQHPIVYAVFAGFLLIGDVAVGTISKYSPLVATQ